MQFLIGKRYIDKTTVFVFNCGVSIFSSSCGGASEKLILYIYMKTDKQGIKISYLLLISKSKRASVTKSPTPNKIEKPFINFALSYFLFYNFKLFFFGGGGILTFQISVKFSFFPLEIGHLFDGIKFSRLKRVIIQIFHHKKQNKIKKMPLLTPTHT